jgi:hypothetical protein
VFGKKSDSQIWARYGHNRPTTFQNLGVQKPHSTHDLCPHPKNTVK